MQKEIPIIGQNKTPQVQMRADLIPSYRAVESIKRGTLNKVMVLLRGGLGDEVCSEPALRFAFKYFGAQRPDFELSVISKYPTLWRHLPMKQIFDGKSTDLRIFKPAYHWTTNYPPAGSLEWEFYCVPFMNTVDQVSISLFKCMGHVEEKDIRLTTQPKFEKLTAAERAQLDDLRSRGELVLLHAGVTWPSRTFGYNFWQGVIDDCLARGITPVLIGAEAREGVGTEPVKAQGCIDLRDRCDLDDTIFLCQRATVVVTNDSAPLHLAASSDPNDDTSGHAWIGYIATIRHPSHISHWRRNPGTKKNEWNWREEHLGIESRGLWHDFDYYLTTPDKAIALDKFGAGERILECLPKPEEVGAWIESKLGRSQLPHHPV